MHLRFVFIGQNIKIKNVIWLLLITELQLGNSYVTDCIIPVLAFTNTRSHQRCQLCCLIQLKFQIKYRDSVGKKQF